MSNIQGALVTLMRNFAPLASLIGGATNPQKARIFSSPADENTDRPYVTYQRISGSEDFGLGGSHGVLRDRFQITSWSENGDQCFAVAEQIRMALVGYSDTVTTPSNGRVTIQEITNWGAQDLYDPNSRVHYTPRDFQVAYEVAIPNPS